MFNKGLCIFNSYSENKNNEYKYLRLKEEFNKLHIELIKMDAITLLPIINNVTSSFSINLDFDFVIYLDKDNYLARALSLKFPMFNSYESLILSDDKMLSLLKCSQFNIKCPKTIAAPLCYIDNPSAETVKIFLDKVEKELSYPLVFKECHGSLGKQVILVSSREELEKIYDKYKKIPHLYEEFLKEHKGHDYRIIVVDHKVVACMERINNKDFRSNIALGGKGYAIKNIKESYKEMALKVCDALDLLYAGIDIAIGKNEEPIFIEANGNAFFTEIEKVTNINIAEKIVYMIFKRVYIRQKAF